MQKIEKYISILIVLLFFTSCSEYQHALNKGSANEKYEVATKLYEAGKYKKAIPLFEKAVVGYRGKPQMERIQYMLSNAYYQAKDYELSAYHLNKFTKNYPKSSKKEEAAFLSAKSYFFESRVYSLDQTETNKAMAVLQKFIDTYPTSSNVLEANAIIKEMQEKLEKKEFEKAKQYLLTGDYNSQNYKAAIVAFDNLIANYLGTKYKEEAMYLKFKAAYALGMKSIPSKKEERIIAALTSFNKLKRSFVDSKYLEEAAKMQKKLEKELETVKNSYI